MQRTTDAKPGSAWDVWHNAGYEFAANNGADDDMGCAAGAFASARDFPTQTVTRAFKEGALNYIKTNT